ncbi:MAG: class I SAM-dependent methyltransferase [Alphaproteobacteria bacterium GM7ARS4]|nr:class I SAM-dependent methyltransferase [Alphaproteobacteria bacterium GM7ARS4]
MATPSSSTLQHADDDVAFLLAMLRKSQYGTLSLTLADGTTELCQGDKPGPEATLHIHDHDAITSMLNEGDVGFAKAYQKGQWDSPHIPSLIHHFLKNKEFFDATFMDGNMRHRIVSRLRYWRQKGRLFQSKRNVLAHYDLGNDFYALWLDPTMGYTCGLFLDDNDTLEQAQNNKVDRILDKIGDVPQHILEIGCGWGNFIRRACGKRAHRVSAITLSPQQKEYTDDVIRTLKIGDKADVTLKDYRQCRGRYDVVVSIGMFEAVGKKYWLTYLKKVKDLLKPGGKAYIQTILIDERHFRSYIKGTDAMRTLIFPGGALPSLERFCHAAQKVGFRAIDIFTFGSHYAKTLTMWLQRFDAQKETILRMESPMKPHGAPHRAYDEAFYRLWRYYLASCAGAFAAHYTDVMQIELLNPATTYPPAMT